MRVAAIDCGTNSIRLLIADVDGNNFREVTRDMELVRLGQGVDKTGQFNPDAISRTLKAVEKFADEYFLNEDYKRAIKVYQKAFKLKEGGLFLFNIAVCYEKLNDTENAFLYMNQCLELRIKNNSTKASINEATKKIKQYQKALK